MFPLYPLILISAYEFIWIIIETHKEVYIIYIFHYSYHSIE